MMTNYVSDIGFTPSVKAAQESRGSRHIYQKQIEQQDWQPVITPDFQAFIGRVDSFYLATASADGQPYIQHRGGPPGFLRVLDEKTLAIADFAGNRQYITLGNLAENNKAHIFLMDYANQQRIKIWGTAEIIEGDQRLLQRLASTDYRARPERVLVFHLIAWDVNCPQHIPKKFGVEDIEIATRKMAVRIQELEAENADLKAQVASLNPKS